MTKTISIQNLCYSIPYADSILEDINLEVGSGEFIGVLGHNGSGKTTLMDILLGFRGATSGVVSVLGENPHAIEREHKEKVVYLSQDVSLKGNITIGEFLKFHSSFFSFYSIEDERHLLNVFELDPDAKIGSLSTGQQKKVQVVAGFSVRPKIIIIDEITAVMDPETRAIFFSEIQNIRTKHQSTVLLATNIAEDLVGRADEVVFISDKRASLHSPLEIMDLFNLNKVA